MQEIQQLVGMFPLNPTINNEEAKPTSSETTLFTEVAKNKHNPQPPQRLQ